VPNLATDDVSALIGELRSAGVKVLASVPRGGRIMHGTDLRGPVAVMIGGEGPGLASTLVALADGRVTIPMTAPVESLNAAVAAALLVYEARRQREVRS
jgi:TrmH family RNA methyltransferase